MVNDDLVLRQQTLTHALHHRFCINQEASFYRGFAMGKDQEIFHDLPEVAPLCFGGQLLMEELIQSVIRLLSLKLVITLDELLQDSIKGSLMYGARFHEDLKNSGEIILCSWLALLGRALRQSSSETVLWLWLNCSFSVWVFLSVILKNSCCKKSNINHSDLLYHGCLHHYILSVSASVLWWCF